MTIYGAVIKEQGIEFAIVIVKPWAMEASKARKVLAAYQPLFSGKPVVLASRDTQGVFCYRGRKDLVGWLASISASRIRWKKYTVSV